MARKQLNRYLKDYVVFDLETTGLSPWKDKIIEISAIKVIEEEIVDEFSTLVNPEIPIPYWASRVNGITDDMVLEKPTIDQALKDFFDFVGGMPLVGHNIHTFDMKFIDRDSEMIFGVTPDNDYLDTLKYARMYLPELCHYKLTDLAGYYNISSAGAHRALNDCRMNQQVFKCLSTEADSAKIKNRNIKVCPKCGSPLKKRNGKFGEFYGCTSYPQCKYTENIK